MGEVFKKSPAMVIDAVVLQDKQLAYIPGGDVTGNLYCSASVVFGINFDYLQNKHGRQPLATIHYPGFFQSDN